MRLCISTLTDRLTVHAGHAHVTIAPGDEVDLDQRIGDVTLEAWLGPYRAAFIATDPEQVSGAVVIDVLTPIGTDLHTPLIDPASLAHTDVRVTPRRRQKSPAPEAPTEESQS